MIKISKGFILMLCILLSSVAQADDMSKYLAGAVPEVNGKVVFTKTINVKEKLSASQIYSLIEKWAEDQTRNTSKDYQAKIVFADPQKYELASQVKDVIVFKSTGLVLDDADISYYLIIKVEDAKCEVTIRNIRYEYAQDKGILTAEEMITDKEALNKNKTKMYPKVDKFRIATINLVEKVFNEIEVYLNGTSTPPAHATMRVEEPIVEEEIVAVQEEIVQPKATAAVVAATNAATTSAANTVATAISATAAATTAATATLLEEVATKPSEAPLAAIVPKAGAESKVASAYSSRLDNLKNDMFGSGLSNNLFMIDISKSYIKKLHSASMGELWGKPVIFCFADPTNITLQAIGDGDIFSMSYFETPDLINKMQTLEDKERLTTEDIKKAGLTPFVMSSGAVSVDGATLIIECRKITAQKLTQDAIDHLKSTQKGAYNGPYIMYVAEIINIWAE